LLLNEEKTRREEMLQWLESPLHEERSMQMIELLAGCWNADDEMVESKNFFWLVVKMS
jgi:hypothetical protein